MQNPVLKKEFDSIINKREFHSNVTRLLQNQFGDHIVDLSHLLHTQWHQFLHFLLLYRLHLLLASLSLPQYVHADIKENMLARAKGVVKEGDTVIDGTKIISKEAKRAYALPFSSLKVII
jgi:6-phosphogluconate dehydrogenase (decarboxylating)